MKFVAVLAVLVAVCGSASAATLTFNTAGSFFGAFATGSGTDTVTVMGATPADTLLMFIGLPSSVTVGTSPTNINYGFIHEIYLSATGNAINVPAFTFNLVVNNTTSGTTGMFVGSAPASIVTATSSNLTLNFASQTLMDGNGTFFINSPATISNDPPMSPFLLSLDGNVTVSGSTATPEPGSLFLLGAGLLAIGFSARKKFGGRR